MTRASSLRETRTAARVRAEPLRLKIGTRILVAGASGAIGSTVLRLLMEHGATVGAHYYQNGESLRGVVRAAGLDRTRVQLYAADLSIQRSCHELIDAFVAWAGGIDGLVQLSGNVSRPCGWEELSEADWLKDINVNLSGPFFLVQRTMQHMRASGGRIILTSTASAKYGGGRTSMAYGVAKAGVECLVKGFAREGAPYGILVNGIAPGFIESQFHRIRMGRSADELKRRAALVPLKRAGKPEDVAHLILYLLSSGARYITGECVAVSGGDWL